MGFWRKSKADSSAESSNSIPWITLNQEAQLDQIIADSFEKPQMIFKHSTRCGISSMVMDRFSQAYPYSEEEANLYYLDLLKFRPVSDLISSRLNIWHESPQLIVLENGQVKSHASHNSILQIPLKEAN